MAGVDGREPAVRGSWVFQCRVTPLLYVGLYPTAGAHTCPADTCSCAARCTITYPLLCRAHSNYSPRYILKLTRQGVSSGYSTSINCQLNTLFLLNERMQTDSYIITRIKKPKIKIILSCCRKHNIKVNYLTLGSYADARNTDSDTIFLDWWRP